MSASGSPLSSNTRIEPAVALKDSVRLGSATDCFVVESGGRRCCSGVDALPAALAPGPALAAPCPALLAARVLTARRPCGRRRLRLRGLVVGPRCGGKAGNQQRSRAPCRKTVSHVVHSLGRRLRIPPSNCDSLATPARHPVRSRTISTRPPGMYRRARRIPCQTSS